MSAERDVHRIVRSWLRTNEHESADAILGIVLSRLDTTPQRRSWWPARRSTDMNRFLLTATAAAAVLAVAFVGFQLLPDGDVGTPATVAPTPAATASLPPERTGAPRMPDGDLAPGSYSFRPFPLTSSSALVATLTVPSGWNGVPNGVVADAGTEAPGGAVVLLQPTGLFRDPCEKNAIGAPMASAGTTVDDLVNALREVSNAPQGALPMYVVGTAVPITVGGHAGKRVDVLVPSGVDFAVCGDQHYWIWDAGPYAQGLGNHWHLWILDVDGTRVVILAEDHPTTPSAVHREMQDIAASFQFQP